MIAKIFLTLIPLVDKKKIKINNLSFARINICINNNILLKIEKILQNNKKCLIIVFGCDIIQKNFVEEIC